MVAIVAFTTNSVSLFPIAVSRQEARRACAAEEHVGFPPTGWGSIVSAVQQLLGTMQVTYSDPAINTIIRNASSQESATGSTTPAGTALYTRHFTQNEEFFLRFPREYTVSSCPIDHDVRASRPGAEHLERIRNVVEQISGFAPEIFAGLTHLYDPMDVFRPLFFRLYKMEGQTYLYALRVDLHYRPALHHVTERGTNDRTPSYRTNAVIVESDLIPLERAVNENGKLRSLHLERPVGETWVGESGRGYFVQGIWIDRDITRFFSKLFIPPGVRTYPYYPFTCKYRAITHAVATLTESARRRSLPFLHEVRAFLLPRVQEIEKVLQKDDFNEQLPSFNRMKSEIAPNWNDIWKSFSLRMYLNDEDQREYELEHGIF